MRGDGARRSSPVVISAQVQAGGAGTEGSVNASVMGVLADFNLRNNKVLQSFTVLLDGDGDGVPDEDDAFPDDPAASVDTDGDGAPDAWNANATQEQIAASDLVIDALPNDPNEQIDSDGDGVGNNADLDDDNDGLSDEAEVSLGTNPQ